MAEFTPLASLLKSIGAAYGFIDGALVLNSLQIRHEITSNSIISMVLPVDCTGGLLTLKTFVDFNGDLDVSIKDTEVFYQVKDEEFAEMKTFIRLLDENLRAAGNNELADSMKENLSELVDAAEKADKEFKD